MRKSTIVASVGCALFAWGFLSADVRLKIESYSPQGDLEETGMAYIQGDRFLRMEPEVDEQGRPQDNSIIFDSVSQTFWVIDHEQEQYLRLDKATVEQMSSQIKSALDQMRAQLDQLPAEQRKLMEDSLKAQLPSKQVEFSSEVRKIGPEDGGVKYEVWVNGKEASTVWTKPAGEIGLPEDALEVFRKMSAFYDDVMKTLSTTFPDAFATDNPFASIVGMEGFPVRMQDVQSKRVTKLSVAGTEPIDPAMFAPPADYKEKKLDIR